MRIKLKITLILTMLFISMAGFASPDSTVITEDIFKNVHASGTIGGAELNWSLDYNQLNNVQNLVVRSKKKIDKKKPWVYSDVIDAKTTSITLSDLKQGEKYIWEVGCRMDGGDLNELINSGEGLDSDKLVWSSKASFETERKWGLYMFLVLVGSLGLFIFGMKMMSEGLQQSAGGRLRQILGSMTSNRYLGVLSGFLITALVQSSSATTVMTVSFVNAGLLTLVESAGVMMGANIGTTITGWLVSVFGFKVSISSYSLIFIAIGAPFLFVNRKNFKAWANAIIGFAILFMGLGFLKDSVPPLGADSVLIEFFTQFSDYPFLGRVLFVILGTLVTIIIQSSSAAMALTLTLVLKNIIPMEVGAAMILGENIGTTITAELASLVGNVHAKRSARIHSMFNIIGVTWMIFMLPLYLRAISAVMDTTFGMNASADEGATIALAAFHTAFNLTNVLIMIWFVPWLVKVATKTVTSKGEDDEIFKLEYISTGITTTPELSVLEARKEVAKFSELTHKMLHKVHDLVFETEIKPINKLLKKISKYEDITDNIEREVAEYLGNLSASSLSNKSSAELRAMLSIINDLERIGDVMFQISKIIEKKTDKKLWFDQKQRDQLKDLIAEVDKAFEIMKENLNKKYDEIDITSAKNQEHAINEMRNKIRKKHLKSMEKGEYKAPAGLIYSDIFSLLEKVGDHVINISEAASGINLE